MLICWFLKFTKLLDVPIFKPTAIKIRLKLFRIFLAISWRFMAGLWHFQRDVFYFLYDLIMAGNTQSSKMKIIWIRVISINWMLQDDWCKKNFHLLLLIYSQCNTSAYVDESMAACCRLFSPLLLWNDCLWRMLLNVLSWFNRIRS